MPADFPQEARRQIALKLATSIAGKPAYKGETIGDLIGRYCPDIYDIAEREGFVLTFAIPENTHAALKRGVIDYLIRRPPIH